MLLALCACNRVLGLGDVGVRDAHFFDGLVDAQPYCPTTLGVVPRFSPVFHEVIDQDCYDYTTATSANLALAVCRVANVTAIYQGPIDGELAPAQGLPMTTTRLQWFDVRISPEGDHAYATEFDATTGMYTFHTFDRSSPTGWQEGPIIPLPASGGGVSTVTIGPQRHLMFAQVGGTTVEEWSQDSVGAWHHVRDLDLGRLIRDVWLGADGLRMVVTSETIDNFDQKLQYFDRSAIDDVFDAPVELTSLPPTGGLFITADCTRAYVSSTASIFYAQQI
jgi:hypothetical protein